MLLIATVFGHTGHTWPPQTKTNSNRTHPTNYFPSTTPLTTPTKDTPPDHTHTGLISHTHLSFDHTHTDHSLITHTHRPLPHTDHTSIEHASISYASTHTNILHSQGRLLEPPSHRFSR